jgi:hypothetical protein
MTAIVTVETLVLALVILLLAGLLRSHAELLRVVTHLEGLLGTPSEPAAAELAASTASLDRAPDLIGDTLQRGRYRIPLTPSSKNTLIAFLSSGCSTCGDFWREFRESADLRLPAHVQLVIVAKDRMYEAVSQLRKVAPEGIPMLLSSQAWTDYHVPVSPYFVYVDGATGRIHGSGSAETWDQAISLLADAVEDADDELLVASGVASKDNPTGRTTIAQRAQELVR